MKGGQNRERRKRKLKKKKTEKCHLRFTYVNAHTITQVKNFQFSEKRRTKAAFSRFFTAGNCRSYRTNEKKIADRNSIESFSNYPNLKSANKQLTIDQSHCYSLDSNRKFNKEQFDTTSIQTIRKLHRHFQPKEKTRQTSLVKK